MPKPTYRDDLAILRSEHVDLKDVAEFLISVYELGIYAEPRDYTKRARKLIKPMDAKIVELARRAATLDHDRSATRLAIEVAGIRDRVESHFWRAERITEEMERRAADKKRRAAEYA